MNKSTTIIAIIGNILIVIGLLDLAVFVLVSELKAKYLLPHTIAALVVLTAGCCVRLYVWKRKKASEE